jgi:hypothetical protein
MAHISSIGAGMFSDLSVTTGTLAAPPATDALWAAEFATAPDFISIPSVREFPAVGTPANIVNVPVYGQKTSSQVQGQADAPSMEVQVNYVPSEWTALEAMIGDGIQYGFRFTLLNAEPVSLLGTTAGIGQRANSSWYWIGKLEALLVTPQLTDANTATLTLSVQSDFFGAYTLNAT